MSKFGSKCLNWVTTNALLQKYPRLQLINQCYSREQLEPVLAHTIISGFFRNPFVSSRVLNSTTMFTPPDWKFTYTIFSQMNNANVFSFNTMIKFDPCSALSIYFEMLRVGLVPDKHTFPFLIKSLCSFDMDINVGKLVHAHVFVFGFGTDMFAQTTLLSMYFACGDICAALDLFIGIRQKDVATWTAVISGLVSQRCHTQALCVFKDMRSQPKCVNSSPNVATMVSTTSASASLGSLDLAKSLHAYVEKVGLESDIFVRNSMIDSYAKCGSIACAVEMFDCMSYKDVYTWTVMIAGLASHGLGTEALNVFACMHRMQVLPDHTSFIAILTACSHSGLVNEGIKIFESMQFLFNLKPELKHYGCMVDLLSRAGHLDHAYETVSSMPMEPNLEILGALLSACRVHGNLELAALVIKKIEVACKYHGGAHVLLSNMYADQKQWHEVVSIREESRGGKTKPQGQSCI